MSGNDKGVYTKAECMKKEVVLQIILAQLCNLCLLKSNQTRF